MSAARAPVPGVEYRFAVRCTADLPGEIGLGWLAYVDEVRRRALVGEDAFWDDVLRERRRRRQSRLLGTPLPREG